MALFSKPVFDETDEAEVPSDDRNEPIEEEKGHG